MRGLKGQNRLFLAVINTLEGLSAGDRPVHGISPDTELAFKLVKQIKWISRLAVKLVDKGKYRNISCRADLKKLSGLRLDTLCRVYYHYRRIRRHKGTVGILGEVLVSGSIKNVDAIALIFKLHDRGGYRNTSLLFKLHPVGYGMLIGLLALYGAGCLNSSSVKQKFLCKCGFTRVRVGNYRKCASSVDLVFQICHVSLRFNVIILFNQSNYTIKM